MKRQSCCGISGECLNAVTITAANQIAQGLTTDEIGILSLFFTVLGDALGLIVATRSCEENQNINIPNS